MNNYLVNNFGIQQVFYAYQKWAAENIVELRLPGLQEFTPQQIFWIVTAQRFCSNESN